MLISYCLDTCKASMFRESQWRSGRKLTTNGKAMSSNPAGVPCCVIDHTVFSFSTCLLLNLRYCVKDGGFPTNIRKGTELSFHFSNCTILRIN